MMAESKIPELLAKLEKHDPETYFRYHNVLVRFGLTTVSPGLPFAWLQYVIQDAIAAQKWVYEIYVTNIPSASIQYGPNTGDDTGDIWAKSPAEALLAAYVAALEAEAENAN